MINQLLLNGIIAGSIYALIAIGFTVIYHTVKFFHLAHGIVYTAGAYFAYTLFRQLHFNCHWPFKIPHPQRYLICVLESIHGG